MNKPIILFTNFWDANKLIDRKYFIFSKDDKTYKVNLIDDPLNYNVLSIALAHPPIKSLPNINSRFNLDRLDFFCPTYDMLMDYKGGGEWDDYVKKYKLLLKKRKSQIVQWIKSLTPERVYILCCWENTSKGANCHRDILYDVFTASESMKDKAIYISRDGTWDEGIDDGYKKSVLTVNQPSSTHSVEQMKMMSLLDMVELLQNAEQNADGMSNENEYIIPVKIVKNEDPTKIKVLLDEWSVFEEAEED